MGIPQDDRVPYRNHRQIEFKNVGSVDIPAYGVVQVDGASRDVEGRTIVHVKRPVAVACGDGSAYMINGLQVIPVGATRAGTNDYPTYALYDSANTPAAGETWGPSAGSFLLTKGASGFTIVGDPSGGIVRVTKAGSGRSVRWGKTTTNATHPTYPSRHANTFVVQLGTLTFTQTPGCQTPVFTADSPANYVIGHSVPNHYVPENTYVRVEEIDCYYFIDAEAELFAEALLNSDMCGDNNPANTSAFVLPRKTAITIPAAQLLNEQEHRGKTGQKIIMVKEHADANRCDREFWHIIDVQLRRACPVVYIKGDPALGDSCLVAAGLGTALEWCDDDEPNKARKIVDYVLCLGEELDACVDSVSFDACYFCVNVGDPGCS